MARVPGSPEAVRLAQRQASRESDGNAQDGVVRQGQDRRSAAGTRTSEKEAGTQAQRAQKTRALRMTNEEQKLDVRGLLRALFLDLSQHVPCATHRNINLGSPRPRPTPGRRRPG